MKSIRDFLYRIKLFISELKPLWIFLAGLLFAAIPLLFFSFPLENNTRFSGFILQLIAVLKIFYDIKYINKQFKTPSFLTALKDLFIRIFKGKIVDLGQINFSEKEEMNAYMCYKVEMDTNSDIKEVIQALNFHISNINCQISSLNKRLDDKIDETQKEFFGELKQNMESIKTLKDDFKNFATGNISLSLISALWLIIGLIFGNLYPEIASLLCCSQHP